MPRTTHPRTRDANDAFTLLEVLVAVGAVALVAVGIATIFDATGKTVRTGRRVSAFNTYANLIQQRFRADFDAMTREGYLVIHHQYADSDGNATTIDDIPLFAGDTAPRRHRIDEIMFFVKGDFTSSREPLDPRLLAATDAAAIYYGHGKRRIRDLSSNSLYLRPALDDMNDEPGANLGFDPGPGVKNPNRYPSDWTLVRRLTLLCPPATAPPALPNPKPFGLTAQRMLDSDIQAGLQPATSNIFRALQGLYPISFPAAVRANIRPRLTSGVVDISTDDLALIKSVVTTADVYPNQVDADFFNPAQNGNPDGSNKGVDGRFRQFADDPNVIDRMRSWMIDGLPGWSMANNPDDRTRVRCEPEPPDYLGVINDPNLSDLEMAFQRADQVALPSSNFVPRCTEFIVEWSFGNTYPVNDPNGRAGQFIWHGMERHLDPTDLNSELMAEPFNPVNVQKHVYGQRFRLVDGTLSPLNPIDRTQYVSSVLIHGQNPPFTGDQVMSCFGYVDPTFNPDFDNDGKLESATDAASPTIPWAWPKLIRLTLTLADPNDPAYEQTFQFVLEAPGNPEP